MQPFHRSEFIAALERSVPEVRAALRDLVMSRGYDVDLRPWLSKYHLDVPGLEWFADDARARARFIEARGDGPWRGPAVAAWTAEYQGPPPPPRWEPAITGHSREAMRERFEAYLDDVEEAEARAGREVIEERKTKKIPRHTRWDLLVRRLVRGESYESLADWLATKIRSDDPPGARGVETAVKSLAERIGISL